MGCYEQIRRIVLWILHPLILAFEIGVSWVCYMYEEIRRIVVWLLHPLIIRFRREEPPVRVEHHDYWCGDVPQGAVFAPFLFIYHPICINLKHVHV